MNVIHRGAAPSQATEIHITYFTFDDVFKIFQPKTSNFCRKVTFHSLRISNHRHWSGIRPCAVVNLNDAGFLSFFRCIPASLAAIGGARILLTLKRIRRIDFIVGLNAASGVGGIAMRDLLGIESPLRSHLLVANHRSLSSW